MNNRKNLFCNLFLAPAFLLYTVFIVFAIILSIYYSTLNWTGFGKGTFAGIENFVRLFQDDNFWQCVKNTGVFVVAAVVIQNLAGLSLAYMVSRIGAGYKFFRAAFFVPVVITAVAVATMFMLIFSTSGPLNWFLNTFGLQSFIHPWLSDPKTVLACVAFSEIFQYIGLYFMIHLTGIQSLPADVMESAKIDGASSSTILFKIIVPMMSEVIQVGVLFSLINALKSFVYPWVMTNGGPGYSSAYLSVFMYTRFFQDFKYGYGSSVAVVMMAVLVIIMVVFKSFFNANTKENSSG